jgi:hypothetical protein
MATPSLEARVQRLEDIEAIRVLKHRYATLCDDGYRADPLAALFTEDAVWDGGVLGRFEGRAAIHAFFAGCSKTVPFAIHHLMNPVIEVQGDDATGDWFLLEPLVFAKGDRAYWMAAHYHDRYRREDGAWRFAHVKIDLTLLAPYEAGFAKERIAELPR